MTELFSTTIRKMVDKHDAREKSKAEAWWAANLSEVQQSIAEQAERFGSKVYYHDSPNIPKMVAETLPKEMEGFVVKSSKEKTLVLELKGLIIL